MVGRARFPVPLYPNLQAETINTILTHSQTKVLFAGKLDGWEDMKPGIPEDVTCFSFPYDDKGYVDWNDLLSQNEPLMENPVFDQEDIATIIYTSGTTGVPKGVIHNFLSFSCAGTNGVKLAKLTQEDRFFSYLPLSHVAERFLVETGALYSGGVINLPSPSTRLLKTSKQQNPQSFSLYQDYGRSFKWGSFKSSPKETR